MPTSKDYYSYVAERLNGIDFVSFKKMMGEYIIYYKDKVVGGIYDDRFMLKITKSSEELIPDAPKDIPYENAKKTFVIEDDVELGANTCVDRATMGSTIVHRGTKLDNLCQIAHNVSVGSNTVMAAQSACAGSSKVGEGCVIAGQVGIVGHITIGNHVTIAAQSGVTRSVPDDTTVLGTPALPGDKMKKIYVIQRKLEQMYADLNELKKSK